MSERLAAAIAELVDAIRETTAPAPDPTPPALLSIDAAAARLAISRRALYDALGRGEIASVKIGSRRLIPTDQIERLATALPSETDGRDGGSPT